MTEYFKYWSFSMPSEECLHVHCTVYIGSLDMYASLLLLGGEHYGGCECRAGAKTFACGISRKASGRRGNYTRSDLDQKWLVDEKLGRPKWPSVYITDISDYLNTKNPETLMKRLLNEYKEGKAYRYFSSEWVKEVHYHDLGEHSDKCIIKSKVTPSQAVNNKAYDVWIVIRKDKNTVPGGQILNAYCSCTAGMMGSCNHIAGVLFRMEYAVKTGMTRPTSTSKACEWTVPKKKTTVKMGKARDFTWKKAKYTQLPRNKDKENETNIKKLNFTPLNKSQQNKVEDGEKLRNELKELLAEDMPNSCFMLLMNKKKLKIHLKLKMLN
ncbi:uncharacterized protein LOC128557095 [Mercenaria mercenaria]|uniref:uncharacterized protein LOC128557095 n=1 Tax=Mercenaria mercenaria TaxID=6596 RepID=UPI00234ED010|nr:uncharacterized protein LOC128557095 [Mercenaria mercenaria]